ncbi:hypothetical protein [Nostoc sp.]|uniref:hypothetical protein n=1 Tax=Nostoc sp. TaxID=1180 RepID=UPI002FF97C9A
MFEVGFDSTVKIQFIHVLGQHLAEKNCLLGEKSGLKTSNSKLFELLKNLTKNNESVVSLSKIKYSVK